jgi:methylmalonyl-CoA epimerase
MLASNIIGVHHTGIAVKDIEAESKVYQNMLGFEKETNILLEPPQKVYVQFLILNNYRIELLQPVDDTSPITNFMKKGGIINHLCYESNDIEKTVLYFRNNIKSFQTVPITKASTLKDCYYTFFAKPSGEVIELIYFDKKYQL